MPWNIALYLVLFSLINIYIGILIIRAVLDWIQALARSWRPSGVVLIIANIVYALTDPPLKFLRKAIPPLRLGAVALDVGFLVLIIGLGLLQALLRIILV